jgi:hypothetical protein
LSYLVWIGAVCEFELGFAWVEINY